MPAFGGNTNKKEFVEFYVAPQSTVEETICLFVPNEDKNSENIYTTIAQMTTHTFSVGSQTKLYEVSPKCD